MKTIINNVSEAESIAYYWEKKGLLNYDQATELFNQIEKTINNDKRSKPRSII